MNISGSNVVPFPVETVWDAILDPRVVTARYGGFLRASLPPMWSTTDRDVVLSALKRLAS